MNRVPLDDEAQRDLERRALANVAGLARRLGYLDKLHIRSEKRFVIGAAAGVVLLVLVLSILAIFQGSHDSSDLALQRCAVDVWQSRGQEVRDEIRRTRPDMSARERGVLYEDRMRDLTIAKCGR
ncbi:MAG TPA: hypothetical protein VLL50_12190 [Usitatibacter sp.]|nr:hypothetical protein [Usitatibacter sp.]